MRIQILRVQKNNKNHTNSGVMLYVDYTRYITLPNGMEVMDTFKGNQVIGFIDKATGQPKYFVDYQHSKFQNAKGEWKKNYDRFSSIKTGADTTDKGDYEKGLLLEQLKNEPEAQFMFQPVLAPNRSENIYREQQEYTPPQFDARPANIDPSDINLEELKF